MKKIILLLALFFTVIVSYSETTQSNDEKNCTSFDVSIDTNFVQNQAVTTNSGVNKNSEGHNVCNYESNRYNSGGTFSGYSSFIAINSRAIGGTDTKKIKTRYCFGEKSWQSNTSGMLLRSIRGSNKDLPTNHYETKGNNRATKTDNYFIPKSNTNVTKAIPVGWYCSGVRNYRNINKTVRVS